MIKTIKYHKEEMKKDKCPRRSAMLSALSVNGSFIEMFFSRLYAIYVLWAGTFNSKFQWANKCVKFEPQLLLEGKEKRERYI